MKLTTILFALLLGLTSQLFAQDHLIKVSPFGLLNKNIHLGYEKVINDRQTAAINLNYSFGFAQALTGQLEQTLNAGDLSAGSKFIGYSVTPQYRFYRKKKGAPQGFYYSPYLKYSNRNLSFSGSYEGAKSEAAFGLQGFGAGMQLGVQWLIKDRVVIDWYFLGLGVNYHIASAAYAATSSPESDIAILNELRGLPIIGEDLYQEAIFGDNALDLENEGIAAKTGFVLPGIRSGLSIGVRF